MRRKRVTSAPPEHWHIETEIKINGRHVHAARRDRNGRQREAATECKIRGQRGRYRFVKEVTTPTTSWLDFIGPVGKAEQWRSFKHDQVVRVHRPRRDPRKRAA